MRQTFKFGRLWGIPIGMHWSVLVIMALLAQGLAMALLPEAAPGHPRGVYWLIALAMTVVFLAALLAHEAAHALTAQRFGVRVRRITLWLLGGVAELDGEAPHARGDFLIAVAGPLASLGAAVLFGLATYVAGTAGAPALAVSALSWLAVVNLVLAVFNMLPGAPLDGGRVLRALVWWLRKDRLAAQRVASRVGVVLGAMLMAAGLVVIFFLANFSGLWTVLLGWFLVSAARGEDLDAQLRGRLSGVRVADVMSVPPVAGVADQTVESFVGTIARHHPHRVYPVVSPDGQPIGLISLARLHRVPAPLRHKVTLAEVRAPLSGVEVLTPEMDLSNVAARILTGGHRLALVLLNGTLAGVLCATDVTRSLELISLGTLPSRSQAKG
jgi:Zn-dependent protease